MSEQLISRHERYIACARQPALRELQRQAAAPAGRRGRRGGLPVGPPGARGPADRPGLRGRRRGGVGAGGRRRRAQEIARATLIDVIDVLAPIDRTPCGCERRTTEGYVRRMDLSAITRPVNDLLDGAMDRSVVLATPRSVRGCGGYGGRPTRRPDRYGTNGSSSPVRRPVSGWRWRTRSPSSVRRSICWAATPTRCAGARPRSGRPCPAPRWSRRSATSPDLDAVRDWTADLADRIPALNGWCTTRS